jgi:glycosyltransferase involved in cell wall biosynthesis
MNDTANPLVSVVIPTYNHARYLGRAVQSLLDQTYTNWEAIVIDNYSTDNADELVASFYNPRTIEEKINKSDELLLLS